jgi:hypothetical protein
MSRIHAGAVEAASTLASRLRNLGTRASTTFAYVKKSEVAEALIATWCIEFLRVRKIGGLNVVQIVTISILMLGVKTIITEASRRRHGGKDKSIIMSNRFTSMEPVGNHRDSDVSDKWIRRPRRRQRYNYRNSY